jgi:hypothetical protein
VAMAALPPRPHRVNHVLGLEVEPRRGSRAGEIHNGIDGERGEMDSAGNELSGKHVQRYRCGVTRRRSLIAKVSTPKLAVYSYLLWERLALRSGSGPYVHSAATLLTV